VIIAQDVVRWVFTNLGDKTMNDVKYIVTGVDRQGKRFKKEYSDPKWAFGINLWQGSIWKEVDGKRKLLRRVYN
tara:strand:- start:269 stop:490 length:222 start_codon:yes stop_codon:yes gene_type:complete